MKNNIVNKGQTLIEILVATGIIILVLVGVSDLVTRALGLSSFQRSKNMAVNIAQNQLNYYRQERDLRPTEFFADPTSFSSCVGEFDMDKFGCVISYVDVVGGVEMTVKVTWSDGDKEITTELSQILSIPTK